MQNGQPNSGKADSLVSSLATQLNSPVHGDLVAYFRFLFGVVGCYWAFKQFRVGAISAHYIEPSYHFHYFGFKWVQLFGPAVTYVEFAALGIAASLVAAGLFYRFAAVAFALLFSHLFLADKCLYQNHYYLLCLVSWVMVFIPANRVASLDALWGKRVAQQPIRRWSLWLLRFQIGVPYFFGAIAKMNGDWLAGEPMRAMLSQRSDMPVVGALFTQSWCVFLFAAGGLLFDLLVVPALLSTRFRVVACLFAIVFHLTNAWLFTIGVFPWFMLFSLPIYFPSGSLRRLFQRSSQVSDDTPVGQSVPRASQWGFVLLGAFVAWQLILPLRHFVIPGNVNWTEEGHCFSWHMLVRGKRCALRVTVIDRKQRRVGTVDLRPYLTELQYRRVAREPRLVHELVQYVHADLKRKGFKGIEIQALALVSMNGRKPQHLVDPKVDLAAETLSWDKPDWIIPLTEPLRKQAWDAPISEWEQAVNAK